MVVNGMIITHEGLPRIANAMQRAGMLQPADMARDAVDIMQSCSMCIFVVTPLTL
jgi:hypothetical protein